MTFRVDGYFYALLLVEDREWPRGVPRVNVDVLPAEAEHRMMRLAPLSTSDLAPGLDAPVQVIDAFFHGEPEDSRTRARGQREKMIW
jgi:hypothetical protein